MKYIDTHCHVFPDQIAKHAIGTLSQKSEYVAVADGTLADTIKTQQEWDCHQFVMLDIATSAKSVPKVNDFLIEHNDNKRIFSFGTIHPDFQDYVAELDRLENAGIKGIKFHPGYQNFLMDEKRMYPIYEEVAKHNMILLFHAGYDPAFDGSDCSDPFRAANILRDLKGAKIILAHMGNYLNNHEAMKHLMGSDAYFDVSVASVYMAKQEMEQMIKAHGVEKFLYATDCPWSSGIKTQEVINSLNLPDGDKEKIFYKNAAKLLQIEERDVE